MLKKKGWIETTAAEDARERRYVLTRPGRSDWRRRSPPGTARRSISAIDDDRERVGQDVEDFSDDDAGGVHRAAQHEDRGSEMRNANSSQRASIVATAVLACPWRISNRTRHDARTNWMNSLRIPRMLI